jgi:hypothetical protein
MDDKVVFGGIGAVAGALLVAVAGLFGGVESPDADPNDPPASANYKCPSGWDLDVESVEDAVAPRCERGDYIVWIHPDSSFSHGARVDSNDNIQGDFITVPSEVPNWQ